MIKFNDKLSNEAQPTCGNHLLSAAYLMAGKYYYSKGGSSETIEKDTPIEEQVDLGEYIAVKIKGFDYGAFAVFDKKRILEKPRTRNIIYRKKNLAIVKGMDGEKLNGWQVFLFIANLFMMAVLVR
jgi:hypothetical protein